MNNSDVASYFDSVAATWDSLKNSDWAISQTLNIAGIKEGAKVLDVACGTGLLISGYLEKGAASVVGVDISRAMIELARAKFARESRVSFINTDIQSFTSREKFDRIVIYNAFPHIQNAKEVFTRLSSLLNTGGILLVAHGEGRESINSLHKKVSAPVFNSLPSAKALFDTYLGEHYTPITLVDNESYYAVSATVATK